MRGCRAILAIAVMGICVVAHALAIPARAQTVAPSQLTAPSYRPAPAITIQPTLPGATPGADLPAGDLSLTAVVRQFHIAGEFPDLVGARTALLASLEGKALSVRQMYDLAASLEQTYVRAGYVLVRIVIPPQSLVDGGTLRLKVVDGFIENIDLRAVPDNLRKIVRERIATIQGKRALKLAELERALLLAGEISGLKLKSALEKGTTTGAVNLVLEGEFQTAFATANSDNRLTGRLARWQTTATTGTNNLFGHGEQVYIVAGGNAHAFAGYGAQLRVVSIGAVLPVGASGLTFNPEYTYSDTLYPAISGSPATLGAYRRAAFRLNYPAIRSRSALLDLKLSVESIEQTLDALDFQTPINEDAYRVGRIGLDYSTAPLAGAQISAIAQWSHGLSGRNTPASGSGDIPVSQQGAGPTFDKFSFTGQLIANAANWLRVELSATAQYSFAAPLLKPEKMSLDGSRRLSSFLSGVLTTDSGAVARLEAALTPEPLENPLVQRLEPYVYTARGQGFNYAPTASENSVVNAWSAGAGLRFHLQRTFMTGTPRFEIEAGYGRSDTPLGAEDGRLLAQFVTSF